MKRIAIFASGNGSNTQNIAEHFKKSTVAEVAVVVCNKPNAGVVERTKNLEIPLELITKEQLNDKDYLGNILSGYEVDLIVLAGFLLLIPAYLVESYPNRIVNVHPALLPKYGGKGMYGMNVHKAVAEAGEKETGITIHYVNEHFDEGEIIAQISCAVGVDDTPEEIANKIHALEAKHFAPTIEKLLS